MLCPLTSQKLEIGDDLVKAGHLVSANGSLKSPITFMKNRFKFFRYLCNLIKQNYGDQNFW